MDDSRRTFIITGFIVVIVLAIIFIGIFYLIRAFQNRTPATNTANGIFPKATTSPVPSGNPNTPRPDSFVGVSGSRVQTGVSTTSNTDPNRKIYSGNGYQLSYDKNWGILTCNNSQNIELDPTNSKNQENTNCNYAIKPVTVLVGQTTISNCEGETVKIGEYQVVKSKVGTYPEIDYRWCVQSDPVLDITHRVSDANSQATSKTDYSKEIEELISKLTFVRGS